MYKEKRQLLLHAQRSVLASALLFKSNLDDQLEQVSYGRRDVDDVSPKVKRMVNDTLLVGLVAIREMRRSGADPKEVQQYADIVSDVTRAVHGFSVASERDMSSPSDSPVYENLSQSIDKLKISTGALQLMIGKPAPDGIDQAMPTEDSTLTI